MADDKNVKTTFDFSEEALKKRIRYKGNKAISILKNIS